VLSRRNQALQREYVMKPTASSPVHHPRGAVMPMTKTLSNVVPLTTLYYPRATTGNSTHLAEMLLYLSMSNLTPPKDSQLKQKAKVHQPPTDPEHHIMNVGQFNVINAKVVTAFSIFICKCGLATICFSRGTKKLSDKICSETKRLLNGCFIHPSEKGIAHQHPTGGGQKKHWFTQRVLVFMLLGYFGKNNTFQSKGKGAEGKLWVEQSLDKLIKTAFSNQDSAVPASTSTSTMTFGQAGASSSAHEDFQDQEIPVDGDGVDTDDGDDDLDDTEEDEDENITTRKRKRQ
jgi:hypothetical protein